MRTVIVPIKTCKNEVGDNDEIQNGEAEKSKHSVMLGHEGTQTIYWPAVA